MNNEDNIGMIIVDIDREKIEKLKKKWSKVKKRGEVLEKMSTSGFVISLLSPFDFEGPLIEIATAVIAVVGFFMKRKAIIELDKINGTRSTKFDEDDKNTLYSAKENIGKVMAKRKKK